MDGTSDSKTRMLLDQFLSKSPPQQFTHALEKFLTSPLPTLHPASWAPPADEAAVRLDLVCQLQKNFIESLGQDVLFTASQISTLVLMPLSTLQKLVADTGPDTHSLTRTAVSQGYLNMSSKANTPTPQLRKERRPGKNHSLSNNPAM
ncbi:hypothetical protein SPBR_04481 [Sporothrix brasiliensis 5110]|uniref:Uncharacterized protein n=1 Tax=Sporothrix brasiliensis 5110 TaxID=1398154 RepID=A0A0C2IWT3_9PEZI|nr:uncharacterized protein SPBR_04481 [Sporothrix brasiliensis 5110]KIH93596.1 hypothetical protein SPBR_04481 [Sporothrix brasiliensis 5110]